jgi:hypothetical protein
MFGKFSCKIKFRSGREEERDFSRKLILLKIFSCRARITTPNAYNLFLYNGEKILNVED